jgi:hypothetical protein
MHDEDARPVEQSSIDSKGERMHIVLWTGAGLLLLVVTLAIAMTLFGRADAARLTTRAFVGVWFLAALANGYNGFANHGIPLVNEIAAFVPIFGIPAAAAWFWSRRSANPT